MWDEPVKKKKKEVLMVAISQVITTAFEANFKTFYVLPFIGEFFHVKMFT